MNYYDDPRFSDYVLENSFVLGIHIGVNWAAIELDACLSKTHPEAQRKPSPGEWAAFQPIQLWFKGGTIAFEPSGAPPALDADESWDYGSIDRFEIDGSRYVIEGEFGRLQATATEAYVKEFSDG